MNRFTFIISEISGKLLSGISSKTRNFRYLEDKIGGLRSSFGLIAFVNFPMIPIYKSQPFSRNIFSFSVVLSLFMPIDSLISVMI
jgi:hypothetical protein